MVDINKALKPCPLCGASAIFKYIEQSRSGAFNQAEIECTGCGLVLYWEQEFAIHEHVDRLGRVIKTDRVALNIDCIEAWNRRVNDG